MTIKELYKRGKSALEASNVVDPGASAEFLLRFLLGYSRTEYFLNLEQEISSKIEKQYEKYIERRKNHEPVSQITGRVEFWNHDFFVTKDVLIPRPETEFLVEFVIKEAGSRKNKSIKIHDVGTGTGAIAIACALELPEAEISASDISLKALKVAKHNAGELKVGKLIKFIKSDLLQAITGKFDIVTANLPYIPTEDLGGLALDVHHYEPRLALDGGEGGLVLYERFLKDVPAHLNVGAVLFCEIGLGQGKEFAVLVAKYLTGAKVEIKKDLASFDRIAIIRMP